MITPFLLKGFLVGIAVTAPAGPVTVLCLRRSLTERLSVGLTVALGAATADAFFGLVAVLGLSAISTFLLNHLTALRLLGGSFLIYVGYLTFQKDPTLNPPAARTEDIIHAYISALVLTLSNPVSIFAFAALFAAFGLDTCFTDFIEPLSLIVGIFAGTALWLSLLSVTVHIFKSYTTLTTIKRLNQASGLVLIIFGALTFLSIFKI